LMVRGPVRRDGGLGVDQLHRTAGAATVPGGEETNP
jgi:hypothetical protein